jgi:RHS repeat-associated protein
MRQGRPEETQSAVEYLFMRGMHGDRATPEGGTRSVQVTDSQNVSINDHKAHAGFLRESTVLNGPGGQWVSGTINTPWRHGPTAASGVLEAYLTGVGTVRGRLRLESGGVRWTARTTSFDTSYGMPTQVDDLGDESVAGDEVCTRYEYARNIGTWIVDKVSRVETVAVSCSQTPQRPGDVMADRRTFFDDPDGHGAPPTRGLPVRVQVVDSWNGSTPVWVTTSRLGYDSHGRAVEEVDALDRKVTTEFTPATGGPATSIEVTNPMGHVSTTLLEPAWGTAVQQTGISGRVTELAYDGLGRLTAAWLPGRDRGSESANMTFEYLLRNDNPSAVTTRSLLPDGGYHTSIKLLDGMLRPRQTQAQATGGGRVITDVFYDSRGQTEWTSKPFYDTSNAPPATTLVGAGGVPQIPGVVEFVHDGVGRVTDEIFNANGQEAWRATYAYGGDRVHVTPPAGGTATTTVSDARGQAVSLRQYHAPTPTGTYDETTYAYTPGGELASVTDPAGNTWSWEYDQRGRRVVAHDPDAGTSTTVYDVAGQVLTTTDGRGVTLGHTYDALGRRTSLRDGSTTGPLRAHWVYDTLPGGLGKVSRAIRHHDGAQYVTEVLGYDEAGRPTGGRVTIPATEGPLAGSYDATTTLPPGGGLGAEELVFFYNDVGQQNAYTSAQQIYVYEATYDTLGRLTQRVTGALGKRVKVTHIYDEPTSRLVNTSAVPELKTEVLDLTYSYDNAGNLIRVVDAPEVSMPNDIQCFRYDHLRRLTDAWTPTSPLPFNCSAAPHLTSIGGVAPYRLVHQYDVSGNRQAEHRHGAGTSGGVWQQSTTYTHQTPGTPQAHAVLEAEVSGPGGSALHTYAYDLAGALSERTIAADTQALIWTAEGQVGSIDDSAAGLNEYVYDADGSRLIRRDPGGITLYLGGQELRYDHATQTLVGTRYYSHVGTQIAVRTGGGLTWLVTDHHNTATVAIDAGNLVSQRKRSLPFGELRGAEPTSWPGDKGFVGGTEDPGGYTHIGARLYDPALGRFISIDPIIDLTDPQQMHGYAYANNNPIGLSDASGLYPDSHDTSGAGDKRQVWVFREGTRLDVFQHGMYQINGLWLPSGGPDPMELATAVDTVMAEHNMGIKQTVIDGLVMETNETYSAALWACETAISCGEGPDGPWEEKLRYIECAWRYGVEIPGANSCGAIEYALSWQGVGGMRGVGMAPVYLRIKQPSTVTPKNPMHNPHESLRVYYKDKFDSWIDSQPAHSNHSPASGSRSSDPVVGYWDYLVTDTYRVDIPSASATSTSQRTSVYAGANATYADTLVAPNFPVLGGGGGGFWSLLQ